MAGSGSTACIAMLAAVVLSLPACMRVDERPDEPSNPKPVTNGELVNDTVFQHPSGIILGAAEGAILPSLPVWIEEVSAPNEDLGAAMIPIGPYFSVGAAETTVMPFETPFAIALPVPEGMNAPGLAASALIPEYLLNGIGDSNVWSPVDGTHDEENGLYIVEMSALLTEGVTIVLTQRPDLSSHLVHEFATALKKYEIIPGFRYTAGKSTNFEVRCYYSDCELALNRTLDQIEYAYSQYSKFFDPPKFRRDQVNYCHDVTSSSLPAFCIKIPGQRFLGIELYPERPGLVNPTCGVAASTTFIFRITIRICIEPQNHTEEYFNSVVWHELFHAYQLSRPSNHWDFLTFALNTHWANEGTAAAAAGSIATFLPDPGSRIVRGQANSKLHVRRVDISLSKKIKDWDDYRAQDFWAYLGQSKGLSLVYLMDMVAEGMNSSDVDDQMKLHLDSALSDEYWRWVKNQVMLEDNINFFHPDVVPPEPPLNEAPCHIQPKAVAHDPNTMELQLEHSYAIEDYNDRRFQLQLGPLQSNVVEIFLQTPPTTQSEFR